MDGGCKPVGRRRRGYILVHLDFRHVVCYEILETKRCHRIRRSEMADSVVRVIISGVLSLSPSLKDIEILSD